MDKLNPKEVFFPHDEMREIQDELVSDVKDAINRGKSLLVHAPTGLGKTAATLAPAIKAAVDKKLTVFFLTSRHTQHLIAIDTIKQIKEKYGLKISAVDIIGKKWMCLQPGTNVLYAGEFSEYCKKLRENNECEFYEKTKDSSNKLTVEAKKVFAELKDLSPLHTNHFIDYCNHSSLCPYEMAIAQASKADVIITDYFYLFHPNIAGTFLAKTQKELQNSVIIVDEGHNLPYRVRDLMTVNISTFTTNRAQNEAKKYGNEETSAKIHIIRTAIDKISEGLGYNEEKLAKKEDFVNMIKASYNYEELIDDFEAMGELVRQEQKQSSIGMLGTFLREWLGPDEGFTRIVTIKSSAKGPISHISYRCLDPTLVTQPVIEQSHSTILMSGTLNPTVMYKDLLGFSDSTEEKEFPSPFPEKNKLTMVIPETTTKYAMRSEEQFRRIGEITAEITNLIPGNSAIYFPSYHLRDQVYKSFSTLSTKTALLEQPQLTKDEKIEMLEKFKEFKASGAVLLCASSGNFAEGVDLPGDFLKCVVVVGLPLTQPNLETKELIKYYDHKYKKGWDYGYIIPAFSKTLQSAGRCIRSEKDKGVIVFLDERYAWSNYFKCFPKEWDIKVTKLYKDRIKEFFEANGNS